MVLYGMTWQGMTWQGMACYGVSACVCVSICIHFERKAGKYGLYIHVLNHLYSAEVLVLVV